MPKPRTKFEYEYETIAKLSDWPMDRLLKDVSRGDIEPGDLASVCVWLAQNAKPLLRAKLASKLLPAIFGTRKRGSVVDEQIELQSSPELLRLLFQDEAGPRKKTGKKRGQRNE